MNKGILKFLVLGTMMITQTVMATTGGKCPSRAEDAAYYAKAQVEANRAREHYINVQRTDVQGLKDVARHSHDVARDNLRKAEQYVKTSEFLRSGQR